MTPISPSLDTLMKGYDEGENGIIYISLTSLYPKMIRPSMRRVAWNVKLPRL